MGINGNGWGRQMVFSLMGALVGALVAGTVTWMTLASNVVTRGELIEYMKTNSPYLMEREYVRQQINENKIVVQGAMKEIVDLNKTLVQIAVKLDMLLIEHQKTRDILDKVVRNRDIYREGKVP